MFDSRILSMAHICSLFSFDDTLHIKVNNSPPLPAKSHSCVSFRMLLAEVPLNLESRVTAEDLFMVGEWKIPRCHAVFIIDEI